MAVSDPIADMLTRIRNAGRAKHPSVDVPASRLKLEVTKILKNEGFIKNYRLIRETSREYLRISLKYGDKSTNAIVGLKRISKPGRRVYMRSREVKPVLNGLGVAILSTSGGVITDREARARNVGGEVLCNIW